MLAGSIPRLPPCLLRLSSSGFRTNFLCFILNALCRGPPLFYVCTVLFISLGLLVPYPVHVMSELTSFLLLLQLTMSHKPKLPKSSCPSRPLTAKGERKAIERANRDKNRAVKAAKDEISSFVMSHLGSTSFPRVQTGGAWTSACQARYSEVCTLMRSRSLTPYEKFYMTHFLHPHNFDDQLFEDWQELARSQELERSEREYEAMKTELNEISTLVMSHLGFTSRSVMSFLHPRDLVWRT
jgi:hypothetical protein